MKGIIGSIVFLFYSLSRAFKLENMSCSQSTLPIGNPVNECLLEILDFSHLISLESLPLCDCFCKAMIKEIELDCIGEIQEWIIKQIVSRYIEDENDSNESIEYRLFYAGKPKKTFKLSSRKGEYLSCHLKLMLTLLPEYGFLLPISGSDGGGIEESINLFNLQIEFFKIDKDVKLCNDIAFAYNTIRDRKDLVSKHIEILEISLLDYLEVAWAITFKFEDSSVVHVVILDSRVAFRPCFT